MNKPLPPSIAALQPKKPQEEEGPGETSALWLALSELPRPHKIVPFPRNLPGTDTPIGKLAIWPLTQEEQMVANAEADRYTKKLLQDPQQKDQANLGYHHTYTNEVAIQVLWRACRDPEDLKKPAFPAPNLMRKVLSTDEVGVLFNFYLTVQGEVGPIVAHMSKEEVEGMILRLQGEGSALPFDLLSWDQQRTLLLSTVFQLVNCWMVMSSAGLPLDVSTYAQERVREMVRQALAEAEPATVETTESEEPVQDANPTE